MQAMQSFRYFSDAAQYVRTECENKAKATIKFKYSPIEGCVIKYKFNKNPNFDSVEKIREMTAESSSPYQGKITIMRLSRNITKGDMNYGMNLIKKFKEALKEQGLPVNILKDKSNGFDLIEADQYFECVPRQAQAPSRQQNVQPIPSDPNQPSYSIVAAGYRNTINPDGTVTTERNVRTITPLNEAAKKALEEKK